ncbi:MAG: TraX family protein [Eubacteriales bacterium]|nr:TraX family protein [Eubacteriales bacterium]
METQIRAAGRGISRDAIKYAAMATMLLNHIGTIFLTPGTLWYELFLDVGYFTAPVMCYFLVEGYGYTHSKKRYGLRLFLFALLSELPFCLAFSHGPGISFVALNMIFTLFICFLLLTVRERVQNPSLQAFLVILLFAVTLFSDWALLAPSYTLLFAWAGKDRRRLGRAFLAAALLFGGINALGGIDRFAFWQNLLYSLGGMAGVAAAGVCILFFYNGRRMERARQFSQWFFYLFYPAHLLLLGLLRLAAGL